jgi:hypothetical protein
VNRSGLFRIVGQNIEFRHLLLQEFFAGRGIQTFGQLRDFVADVWWQKAIVFYFGENPGDSTGLLELADTLQKLPKENLFTATVAVGLAVQASYLVEIKHKLKIFLQVIIGLSGSKETFLANSREPSLPINRFLGYYLLGRDAVACSFIGDHYKSILDIIRENVGSSDSEIRTFWLIVGLIEAGHLKEAKNLLDTFAPTDLRLLFSIFLGASLLHQVRIASPEEKGVAQDIMKDLSGVVAHLRDQLLKELKTVLLEVRKGNVHLLEQ